MTTVHCTMCRCQFTVSHTLIKLLFKYRLLVRHQIEIFKHSLCLGPSAKGKSQEEWKKLGTLIGSVNVLKRISDSKQKETAIEIVEVKHDKRTSKNQERLAKSYVYENTLNKSTTRDQSVSYLNDRIIVYKSHKKLSSTWFLLFSS